MNVYMELRQFPDMQSCGVISALMEVKDMKGSPFKRRDSLKHGAQTAWCIMHAVNSRYSITEGSMLHGQWVDELMGLRNRGSKV